MEKERNSHLASGLPYRASRGRIGLAFWLGVIVDELRGIVREHLAVAGAPGGPLRHWPYAALPFVLVGFGVVPLWNDWQLLLGPVALLAVLFLASGGRSGLTAKVVTLAAALGACASMGILASYTGDPTDLLPPLLLLLGPLFVTKSMAALHARSAGGAAGLWVREQVLCGALLGLLTILCMGPVRTSLGSSPQPYLARRLVFFILAPLLCAVAGFMSSRTTASIRIGIDTALATALVGLLLSHLISRSLTVLLGSPPWPPQLEGGQQTLSLLLTWWIALGIVGAVIGGVRKTRAAGTSQPVNLPE
jgi:hypothetical protein